MEFRLQLRRRIEYLAASVIYAQAFPLASLSCLVINAVRSVPTGELVVEAGIMLELPQ